MKMIACRIYFSLCNLLRDTSGSNISFSWKRFSLKNSSHGNPSKTSALDSLTHTLWSATRMLRAFPWQLVLEPGSVAFLCWVVDCILTQSLELIGEGDVELKWFSKEAHPREKKRIKIKKKIVMFLFFSLFSGFLSSEDLILKVFFELLNYIIP